MSSTYRMNVIWSSQGAGLQRDINTFLGGMGQVERQSFRSTRGLSMWGMQMRALGTTIRYALAGSVIYSLVGAINTLGEFETKLGQIDALVGRMDAKGHLRGMGDDLDRLAESALKTSNKFGIAATDVQEYYRAFASAGFAPEIARNRKEMESFGTAISEFQVAAGTEIDPLRISSALSAMLRQGNQRPSDAARRYTSELYEVLKISPVLYGADIQRDLGRLMMARQATRMTPEQILSIYATASIMGGSPAVIGRGVAQLLTASLIAPKGVKQKAAFQQIVGTSDPNALRAMGGGEVLARILRASMGTRIANPTALGSEALTDQEALAQAGVSGINVTLLSKLFGRVESVRIMLSLISAMQKYPDILNKNTKLIEEAGKSESIVRASNLANEKRWYLQLRTAQQNLSMSVMRGMEPVLRPVSRGIKWLSDRAAGHPYAALGVVGGSAAAATAMKFAFAGGIGSIGGRLAQRFPMFGRAAERAPLAAAAAMIGAGAGAFTTEGRGTRGEPIWVMIDPFSWFLPGAPYGPGMAGPGQDRRDKAESFFGRRWAEITGGSVWAASRFPRFARTGLRGAGYLTAEAPALSDVIKMLSGEDVFPNWQAAPNDPRRYPFLSRLYRVRQSRYGHRLSRGTEQMITRFEEGDISAGHFERWLRVMALRNAQGRGAAVDVDGEAVLKVEIGLTPEIKRLLDISAPAGVPVSLWTQGKPQHRGKNKTNRTRPPAGARGPVR